VPIAGWAHTAFGGDSTADDLVKYLMSYYWSMMTLTTVGYGDVPSNTPGEQVLTTSPPPTPTAAHTTPFDPPPPLPFRRAGADR
jgi:hypothetical protein